MDCVVKEVVLKAEVLKCVVTNHSAVADEKCKNESNFESENDQEGITLAQNMRH
jgi:hypothetical protein